MTHSAAKVQAALGLLTLGRSKKSIAKELGISTHSVLSWSLQDREELLTARLLKGEHDRAVCTLITTLPRREYSYLLGQYLGDGCVSRMPKDVYRLRIACCDDYPAIMEEVAAAMFAVLPNKVGRIQGIGCTEVESDSKHWRCLFPQFGAGPTHARLIALARWQQTIVTEHTDRFLRGLFHSDGCRCMNRVTRRGKAYEYTRYFFKNEWKDILHICADALDMLGIEWRFNNPNSISVAKRASVAKLDEFIGPKS